MFKAWTQDFLDGLLPNGLSKASKKVAVSCLKNKMVKVVLRRMRDF